MVWCFLGFTRPCDPSLVHKPDVVADACSPIIWRDVQEDEKCKVIWGCIESSGYVGSCVEEGKGEKRREKMPSIQGLIVRACNSSAWGHCRQDGYKLEVSLGYLIRLCIENSGKKYDLQNNGRVDE